MRGLSRSAAFKGVCAGIAVVGITLGGSPAVADSADPAAVDGSSEVTPQDGTKSKSGHLRCKSGQQVRVYSFAQGSTITHKFTARGKSTSDKFKGGPYLADNQTFTQEREVSWKVTVTTYAGRSNLPSAGAACYSS